MKKNELVHVHSLLTCVAEDFVERGVVEPEAFAPYRALGVSPMSLRASRDDHEAAVRVLAEILSTAARGQTDRPASESEPVSS
ncbi:UPF0058 family protein [Halogeometricum limi]|uniref:Metal-binding protein n=1 Tax=Halogeometricum limi TaxID=555875 RepID=A0A1I6GKG0_9EURY|nr:UPF0058 family protein [Halogeometricum limi]SFR42683.1 hypothetical protein SAMN04488124_1182 [Halogeometricum limi]